MSKVSIIIPTYNRLSRLKHVLAALESQTVPPTELEVVVVSDGATDGTNEFLSSLQTPLKLKSITQTNGGPASARNNAIANASGELLLFVDDDVVAAPQLVAEHLRIHEQCAEDMVVLGPMLTPQDFPLSPWVNWEQEKLLEQYNSMQEGDWAPSARQFYTGNSSVPRLHVLAAGCFDERFRRAEDVELAYRLSERGLKFAFNPNAIGHHYAERSLQSWMATPYAYGRNDVIFSLAEGRHWLAAVTKREFQGRNALVRWLVNVSVGRRLPKGIAIGALRIVASVGNAIGMKRVTSAAYSGIFNLRYYEGVADELGGRKQFLERYFSSNGEQTRDQDNTAVG